MLGPIILSVVLGEIESHIKLIYSTSIKNQKTPFLGSFDFWLVVPSSAAEAASAKTAATATSIETSGPSRTIGHRFGFIDDQVSAVQFFAIPHINGFLSIFLCGHLYESKAS